MKALISILKGIKNGVSKGLRKVKGNKMLQGALLVVVVVSIGAGALFAAYNKGLEENKQFVKKSFVIKILKRLHSRKQQLKRLEKFINQWN